MNLKSLIAVLTFLTFFLVSASAQKEVTIKDPDISFSYYLPEGYANQDDDFYHHIFPKSESRIDDANIQLTYFEGYNGELSAFKDGIVNGKLRNTLENFEFQESGSETIDGTLALYSKFTYTEDSIPKCGELYCFERFDQYFQIEMETTCNEESNYRVDFKRIIRSIRVIRNF